MGEITNQIEQEIRQKRDHLGRNLDELEDKARELADWRTHYRKHSPAFLGAAFGLGVVLGLATISRRQHTPDYGDFDTDLSHDPYPVRPAVRRSERSTGTTARALRQVGETWEQIADALVRTAAVKAIDFVGEFVPGFRDNVRRRDTHYDSVTH